MLTAVAGPKAGGNRVYQEGGMELKKGNSISILGPSNAKSSQPPHFWVMDEAYVM